MAGIFISYRRADSAGFAGRLYDYLSAAFGEQRVFMDIDDIPPGEDFVHVIQNAVAQCDAVIVVIGPQWASIRDSDGGRRLDDPYDFVRLEVATALARSGVRVIPVLVNGATMPRADELPENLRVLVRRNAVEVSNQRFRYDVDRLIRALGGRPRSGDSAAQEAPARSTGQHARNRGRWLRVLILFAIWTLGTTLVLGLDEEELLFESFPFLALNFFLLPLIILGMTVIWPLRTRTLVIFAFLAIFLNGYYTDWYYTSVLDESQAGASFLVGMAGGGAIVAVVVDGVRKFLKGLFR